MKASEWRYPPRYLDERGCLLEKIRYPGHEHHRYALRDAQRGICAICGNDTAVVGRGDLQFDHCHASGFLRQMLCTNCNRGLGHFADNPTWLRRAANYVHKHCSDHIERHQ